MRKPEPVEIAAIFIPVLAEAIAVLFMVGCAILLVGIYATPAVPA